jgi:hypothetical protein
MNRFHIHGLMPALLIALSLGAGAAEVTGGAENPCDSSLVPRDSDPQGYRLRGDRCEGIYIREVAGSAELVVASFTESFGEFQTTSDSSLRLAWPPLGRDAVRLRAQGLKYRLHYRMDSIRPPGSSGYTWPLAVLAALRVGRQDIGVVGYTAQQVGNSTLEVYLPLRISERGEALPSHMYRLVLLPGAELNEVYLSLAPVGRDGRPGKFLQRDQALRRSYYPAERPISVDLPEPYSRGIYYLEIGAVLGRGGSSTATMWFYSPGR